jgi:hypothetical protein
MPTQRKPTNPDTPDWTLTPQQHTAVDLLVSGKNLQDTATAVEVTRPTVSEWVNHHPGFQAALNQRRQELWADMTDGLRALLPRAIEVLQRELEGEQALSAAVHLLKCCGLYGGMGAPSGQTDAAAIALAQQLAEDDRQHAAEDAAIAVKRKDFDRMLSAMAAEPFGGLTGGGG